MLSKSCSWVCKPSDQSESYCDKARVALTQQPLHDELVMLQMLPPKTPEPRAHFRPVPDCAATQRYATPEVVPSAAKAVPRAEDLTVHVVTDRNKQVAAGA